MFHQYSNIRLRCPCAIGNTATTTLVCTKDYRPDGLCFLSWLSTRHTLVVDGGTTSPLPSQRFLHGPDDSMLTVHKHKYLWSQELTQYITHKSSYGWTDERASRCSRGVTLMDAARTAKQHVKKCSWIISDPIIISQMCLIIRLLYSSKQTQDIILFHCLTWLLSVWFLYILRRFK